MARDELPDLFGDCFHDVCSDAWLVTSTETQLRHNCICAATWDVAFVPQPKLARSPTGTALSCMMGFGEGTIMCRDVLCSRDMMVVQDGVQL